jgi:hypothetical protein
MTCKRSDWGEPPDSTWTHDPIPPEALAKKRAESVDWMKQHGETNGEIVFTCDTCRFAPCCELAFDGYNTDGDCLLSK